MLALMFLALSAAFATPVQNDQRFCVSVDIIFWEEETGDRWTDDTVDRPARGFWIEVTDDATGATVWQGNTHAGGPHVGCTPIIALTYDPADPGAYEYTVTARSDGASVQGNTVHVLSDFNDMSTYATTTLLTGHQASVDNQPIYPSPLPGLSDKRWNTLALATFALYLHDGGVDATYKLEVGGPHNVGYHGNGRVAVGDPKKWVQAHELGHAVSDMVNGGLGLAQNDGAALDNCNGSSGSNSHNYLSKEWHSVGAVEGIANWFAAITWNIATEGDCEIGYWHWLDFDLDFDIDVATADPSICFGDPWTAIPVDYVTANDWLEDLVDAPDLMGCFDPEVPYKLWLKSTEYDWLKFYWDLDTVQGYSIAQVWDIWDEADPHAWDPNGSTGSSADDPPLRMHTAAIYLYGTGAPLWLAASKYGLDR